MLNGFDLFPIKSKAVQNNLRFANLPGSGLAKEKIAQLRGRLTHQTAAGDIE